jgi:2-polyprenyl-6-methoxyphenol hydroxylase-like FAD-dependent oxidoreductase
VARHAEIAGGGIAGLGLGMMLARRGWTVRIHERSPGIREIGSGIALRNNCVEVFEHYGVFPRLAPHGTMLKVEKHLDRRGRFLQARSMAGHHRTFVMPRQTLVDVMAAVARESGAEIVTNSLIAGADLDGALIGEDGRRYPADLVVGADGVRSRTRASLPIGARFEEYPTKVGRWLLEGQAFTEDNTQFEVWSGDRRVGIMPCGTGQSYIYTVMPARDQGACAMPIDADNWSAAFPRLNALFAALNAAEGSLVIYPLVTAPSWSAGRVALVGDAAHGMPPTLGQGVGLAMINCHALAELVTRSENIEQALEVWESSVRFLSDATRRWAIRYDRFTRHWPRPLRMFRPQVIRAVGRIKMLNERMRIADRGLALTNFSLERP